MAPALNYAASVQTNNPQVDKAMLALIHSESRGHPEAHSPADAWGSTQVLDSTGAQLASELGVQWQPSLMRGSSPQAIAYQYAIGRRYLEKGLGQYKNWADAFRFYHGGPNQSGWKGRTNTYAAYNVEKMRQMGVV